LEEAKEILNQIQGSTANIPAATINLAHILTEMRQPRTAVAMYESVLKKHFESKDAYILQCISRAYYIIGKSEKDFEAMKMALLYIQKAARINPSDLSLFFDIALVKQQYAHILNDQAAENRPIEKLEKALAGLEVSRIMFQGLSEKSKDLKLGYDIKHATERFHYCKEVRRVTEKKIHEVQVLKNERERRLKEIKEVQEEFERAQIEEEERLRREEENRQEKIEDQRRELQKRMYEDNTRAQSMVVEESGKKSRKKGAESGDDDDQQPIAQKKRKLAKKAVISSDEDL